MRVRVPHVGVEKRTGVPDSRSAESSSARVGALPDYLERNRSAWDRWAPKSAVVGARSWRADELRWGHWNTPESRLRLLDGLPAGSDIVELGCGAGAIPAWLKRYEMHPVGVDFSAPLLRAAEQLQHEHGVYFPLILANAEQVPYDRESFDVAVSEYGASVWCDPRRWLLEANRLLRHHGTLIFFTNSPLLMVCTPVDGGPPRDALVRDYFSGNTVEFGSDTGIEFHFGHGEWIQLLRTFGFEVERLVEVRPTRGATPRFDLVSIEWAQRWPSEEVWMARKVSQPRSESLQAEPSTAVPGA